MGMAASQGRLLSITARMSDLEFNSQQVSQSKIRLAMSGEEITRQYTDALDKKQLVGMLGNGSSVEMNYALLTGADSPLAGDYILTNANNQVIVSKDIKASYDASGGDINKFLSKCGAAGTTTTTPGAVTYPSAYPDEASFSAHVGELTKTRDNYSKVLYNDDGTLKIPETIVQTDAQATLAKATAKSNWDKAVNDAAALAPSSTIASGIDNSKGAVPFLTTKSTELNTLVLDILGPNKDAGGALCRGDDGNVSTSQQLDLYNKMMPVLTSIISTLTPQVAPLESKVASLRGTNALPPQQGEANYDQYTLWNTELTNMKSVVNDTTNAKTALERMKTATGTGKPEDDDTAEQSLAAVLDILYGTTVGGSELKGNGAGDYGSVYGKDNRQATMDYERTLGYTHSGAKGDGYSTPVCATMDKLASSFNANVPPTAEATQKYQDALKYANGLKTIWENTPSTGGSNPNPAYTTAKSNLDKAQTDLKTFTALKTTAADTVTGTPGPNTAYYTHLFNRIKETSCAAETDDNLKSAAWLNNQLANGGMFVEKYDGTAGVEKFKDTDVSSSNELAEKRDETDVKIIEAKYDAEMAKIQNKDKQFDLTIKQIDTEHGALQTEAESVKKVIDKNIESTFKSFG